VVVGLRIQIYNALGHCKEGANFRALPSPHPPGYPRGTIMRLRKVFGLGLALALGLAVSACRDLSYAAGDPHKLRVGIVFDSGGKDDRSFNAAAWKGVRRAAKDFPIVLRDAEPGDPTSLEPAMRAFAEVGYDLVIGIGFAQTPIVEAVAKDYPKINFAIVDGVSDLPNVASLIFKEHEGSYLVGMIAAEKSKTGVLGFVGGMDIPLIHKFEVGYEEGARAVNPRIQVIQNYVGVTESAWNNPGKGKELSVAQIGKGVDVIFAAAGNSGLGAFDAAEQYGKYVIGVDSNQNWVKPGFVLTSMVKRVDNAVYQIVGDMVNHRFKGGIHVYGLENDGIGYAMDQYNAKLIPPDVIRQVEAARARIIRGEIKVTDAMAK
jgi:basic membrane protein A